MPVGVDRQLMAEKVGKATLKVEKPPLWDPTTSTDWDNEPYTREALIRIKRDLQVIYKDPSPGICVVPNDEALTELNIVIIGPSDTPYEGGLFQFLLRVPPNYPLSPPRVKLLTTGGGTVRFNPNFYNNGKVCLSILVTWEGPSWSGVQSLQSVLLSIQSLMNATPYQNEPGYDSERFDLKRSNDYNNIVVHETLRVAVCGAMETTSSCSEIEEWKKATYLGFYDYYCDTIKRLGPVLDGFPMMDPFHNNKGTFNFSRLSSRLKTIYDHLSA